MYLLKCLKAKGLPIFKLHNICQAIIIFKIMYSIPAWGRFCQQNLKKNRIDGLLCHLHRYGYTPTLLYTEQTLCDADEVLFHKVLKTAHCLNKLLPQQKCLPMELRPASHNFQLPVCNYNLHKNSFVVYLFQLL